MNVITVTGNAVKEIEIRYTATGVCMANGSIAVRRDFKNKTTGEYETDFFNFLAIGGLGEVMGNHIKKGDKFGITGRLQNRVWEKDDGTKQYFTEIIVNSFDFPSKPQNNQSNTNTGGGPGNPGIGQNSGQIDVSDDMLPF